MKDNLIKIFISFVICYMSLILLKHFYHYDGINYLAGALCYSLYEIITVKHEKKRIFDKIQK